MAQEGLEMVWGPWQCQGVFAATCLLPLAPTMGLTEAFL